MTFREPYSNPIRRTYRWVHAPLGWLAEPAADLDPFRRYMLRLQAEAIARNVPLAIVYHGQVRGDAAPMKEDTTERRALEEGRQIVRWQDNSSHYQRGGRANLGKGFASSLSGRVR